ncbi:hypothetical protein [Streptomyces sp. NPDC050264]|uniref:hypothetical protein n=1 Tax=Streptomyces sp. NPDC050264 TaxID=3155038 RepID=UPI0034169A44
MPAPALHVEGREGEPQRLPTMPEHTPRALRSAIQEHAPRPLPDFETRWKRVIGDTFTITPAPAFMRLWWTQHATERHPALDSHLRDLDARAAKTDEWWATTDSGAAGSRPAAPLAALSAAAP